MNQHDCTAVSDIKGIKDDLTDIKKALLGTEYHPGGVLAEVRKLKDEVERLKDYSERIKYIALGLGLAGGVSVSTIIKFFFA